jgi:hypothetical protein
MLYLALLDNQSNKEKVSFVGSENEDNKVVINAVTCNHKIPKHILTSIEAHINGLFFSNYNTLETYKKNSKIKK